MKAQIVSSWVLCFLFQSFAMAEPQLYPTGPSEDASYIRFVDTLDGNLEIRAGKDSRIELTQLNSSTPWQSVKANSPLSAGLYFKNQMQDVSVSVKPSEFVTVAAVQDVKAGLRVVEVREFSPDFSSLKVSFGFMNLVSNCSSASVRLAGKDVVIVNSVSYLAVARRMVNPVSLGVDVYCEDKRVGNTVNLNLRPGERWTLIAFPHGEEVGLMPVLDSFP